MQIHLSHIEHNMYVCIGLRKYAEEKGYSRIDGRGIKELISTIRNMVSL